MAEDYGEDDYGEDVFGGALTPLIGTKFIRYFPEVLPRELSSTFRQYIDAYGIEFEGFDGALRYTKNSRFVEEADGADLERVGAIFGAIGRKGSRSQNEYRSYLQSLLQSFNARGTLPGLKFAIAAAVNGEPSDVDVIEDFDNNEYELQIKNTDSDFIAGVVNELAQLADPSAVELVGVPVIFTTGGTVKVTRRTAKVIDSAIGLGADTLTLDGNSQLT